MFVKPKPGVQVRRPDPPYAPLPAEGAEVGDDIFWHRRLADGDVELVQPAGPSAHAEPTGPKSFKETSR
jgi:hypothetical protein